MNKKELLVYLMKIDRGLWEKSQELKEALHAPEIDLFSRKFWLNNDEDYKRIKEVIFDYAGIIEDELEREKIREIYEAVVKWENYELSLENFAEILLEAGEKTGKLSQTAVDKIEKSKIQQTVN